MAEDTKSRPRGLLDLPPELRDEIYEYLVVKPTNTITMLENQNCFRNEVSAAQPAISRVNRRIRQEALPMFYKRNAFMAELSNFQDLAIAKSWLGAIGDLNAGHLRRLALCGWTKVALGNQMCRLWIKCVFNLRDGMLEIEGNEISLAGDRRISKDMHGMEDAYRKMVEAREGSIFDVCSLARLMEGFHQLCADYCTEEVRDLDGSCQKCRP